jgi:hypothetical protein
MCLTYRMLNVAELFAEFNVRSYFSFFSFLIIEIKVLENEAMLSVLSRTVKTGLHVRIIR